jgi:predicted dehydrogenase
MASGTTSIMAAQTMIVGCGAVAQKLYRNPLKRLEKEGVLQVTALVDRHAVHARSLQAFFPKASIYEDLEEALEAGRSDLALILSPAQLHAEQTVLALRHNNHVLCEKPMAATGMQCNEVIAAAIEMRRVLAVGMIRRFFPAFSQLKDLVVHGEFGEIRSFSYREGRMFDWDVKTPAGFTRHPGGGSGLLFDIGPHALDYLIWLFGAPEVVSYADDALAGGVEGNILMELESPVCTGSVQLSWDFPLKNELRVVGSKGEAVLRTDEFDRLAISTGTGFSEVTIDHAYAADLHRPPRRTMTPRLYTESIYCQLIQVARAIHLGEPPAVSGEDGRECVRVIETARRRAQPIDMPWLDDNQAEAFRALHWTNA